MKKAWTILSLILTAALFLTAIPVCAGTDAAQEVYAVVELIGGAETVLDEAPGAAVLKAADRYELFVEDASVLSVDHLLAGTGRSVQATQYYSVSFTLPGTQTEVFLTGLGMQDVQEIQQQIIDSYVSGENFSLTDAGFIDTEKTFNEDEDDDLCWAASTSDMLAYTGWGAKAGFKDEDDLFEAFIGAFENDGGHPFYALAWFFNGAALSSNDSEQSAAIYDYPNSGGYLKDYSFDQFLSFNTDFTADQMDTVADRLREGCAVGVGTSVFDEGEFDNGHAMTLWGYIRDRSLPADDPARYTGIFLTDSDSDELEDADRRDAPNVMTLYAPEEYEGYYWFSFDESMEAVIIDYTVLRPYGDALPTETDPGANKDKTTRPDLSVGDIYVTDRQDVQEQKTLFETGSDVSFAFRVNNFSDQVYSGYLYPQVTLQRSDGAYLFDHHTRTYNMQSGIALRGGVVIPFLTARDLEAGDYTLTVAVNPDHSAANLPAEAYYVNNTATVTFRVRDSYLSGDFDDSGEVTIMDAALIQRRLAGYSDGFGGAAAIRADLTGTGLSILDATLVQRYLADYTVNYPVGEKKLYA